LSARRRGTGRGAEMEILLAVLLGAALDLLLGDPRGFPTPSC
jgi:cobalamin biosynthesis protein CobD/CbiB